MFSIARKSFIAALLAGVVGTAFAADPYEPMADPAPPPVVYQEEASADYGGWYLRGDVDYHWTDVRGVSYTTYVPPDTNDFDTADIEESWSLGGGIGYQINKHLRTDLTADWLFKARFDGSTSDGIDTSTDSSHYSSLLLLANAYIDIGTWHGVTPYVGAGIGGAWVKWDDLTNSIDGGDTFIHEGNSSWRFAYALSAGASYCLTQNLKFDAGYRFSHIEGGRMFEFAGDGLGGGTGPGYDDGFYNHEVRGGLRYQFGKSECSEPEQVAYEPLPEPVYTK